MTAATRGSWATGLLGDAEPDLIAAVGPEPEGPVRFPSGLAWGQDPRAAGPVLARSRDERYRQLAAARSSSPIGGPARDPVDSMSAPNRGNSMGADAPSAPGRHNQPSADRRG